jgi:peptide/nickel transport system permease protein
VPRLIRVARGGVLQVRQMEFVEAARAMGVSDVALMARHIVPSILAPVIVQATFTLVYSIRTEATLNFIGLGVPPPAASWGGLLDDGKAYIQSARWMIGAPAAAIALAIFGLTLLGDGLRDYADPRQPGRSGTTPG